MGGQPLPPRNIWSRFQFGVLLVPQEKSLPADRLMVEDARDLAISFRPGLNNELALDDLQSRLAALGLIRHGEVSPRVFDFLSAMMSAPRILLLDEIMPSLPAHLRASDTYKRLRDTLPWTTVLFVDHDLERGLSAADRVIWLRKEATPKVFRPSEENIKQELLSELKAERTLTDQAAKEVEPVWRALPLDRSPLSQVRLALQAKGLRGRAAEETLLRMCGDFEFLGETQPAEVLSGGQRVVLLWILTELVGTSRLPNQLVGHLDGNMRAKIERWSQLLSGEKEE